MVVTKKTATTPRKKPTNLYLDPILEQKIAEEQRRTGANRSEIIRRALRVRYGLPEYQQEQDSIES